MFPATKSRGSLSRRLEINEGIIDGGLLASIGSPDTPLAKGVLRDYFDETSGGGGW